MNLLLNSCKSSCQPVLKTINTCVFLHSHHEQPTPAIQQGYQHPHKTFVAQVGLDGEMDTASILKSHGISLMQSWSYLDVKSSKGKQDWCSENLPRGGQSSLCKLVEGAIDRQGQPVVRGRRPCSLLNFGIANFSGRLGKITCLPFILSHQLTRPKGPNYSCLWLLRHKTNPGAFQA